MFSQLSTSWRRFRHLFDRSSWITRLDQRRRAGTGEHGVNAPGIIMLQIDGLAYNEMLRAIDNRRLPFLQRLVQRDHFVLRPFYSGLPSATPAVQAELFFGVKSAVPAFSYYDRDDGREKNMFDPRAVDGLARDLEKNHRGLLVHGCSYSNIFSGGAEEAPFCIQTMRLRSLADGFSPVRTVLITALHFVEIGRIIGLSCIEAGLAAYDFCAGVYQRKNPLKELKFVFSRIGSSIILREILRMRIKRDIGRGMPIIHANFVGYDEHAHRRGPGSAFAHWTLKGIDAVIRDLVHKAVRAETRDYQVVIYSDHGQEDSIAFQTGTGTTLLAAVQSALACGSLADCEYADAEPFIPYRNLHNRTLGLFRSRKQDTGEGDAPPAVTDGKIHITAMGPLGHIYLPHRPDDEEMQRYAGRLVHQGGIPLVFHRRHGRIVCTSPHGSGEISSMARKVFGSNHPFMAEVAADIETICRHRHAGEFIISGWLAGRRSLTFPIENGSHGGPGSQETRGFVIIPEQMHEAGRMFYRAGDLRRPVQAVLNDSKQRPAPVRSAAAPDVLSIMTYNIHSCIGVDGKLFPERIARVIERQAPDLVALQEVDRGQARSAGQNQADILGEMLAMTPRYFPVLRHRGGEYGIAVLSRHPIDAAACFILPQVPENGGTERRGLIHITAATPLGRIHLLNTHLSLGRRERFTQMSHIVDGAIFPSVPSEEPIILAGDFNCGSKSIVNRMLSRKLIDVQRIYPEAAPAPTYFSTWPMLRLDHIFHSDHLVPLKTEVIDDWESRLASDHLPVIATLRCRSGPIAP